MEDGGEISRARAFGKGDLINDLYSQVKKWIDKWKLINDINSKFDLYFGDIPNVNFEDEDVDLEETEVNVLIHNLIAFRNLSLESKFDDEIKKKIDEVVTKQVKELKENPTLKTKKLTLLQMLEIFHLIYSLGKDFYELAGILWMMTFKVIGVNQQMLAFLSLKP